MRKVAFTTLGCKVNQFETEVIEGLFKQRGYKVVDFSEAADVYVINTCSVTHLGERKSRQLIRRATRANPDATVVVTGCYAQISPEKIQAIPGVDVIVGTNDRQRIVDLVEAAARSTVPVTAVGDIMAADHFEDIPLFDVPGRTRAFLKIQEGCSNFCSYCIIPYARGPLRSRTLASIASEAAKLVAAGFKEIVLTGIHLGAYGRDLDGSVTLTDAVKAVLAVDGIVRLRLGSLESVEVPAELIEIMRTDKRLCPHLHLPLQAGDDHVLLKMNRHYTTDEYRRLIQNIRQQVADIAISTDIIVGFPGETDEMFANSLNFVKSLGFAKLHIFPYSRRSGTPAADYPDQVEESVKRLRAQAMQQVGEQQARTFNKRFIGRELEVLFETINNGIIDGLTGNYVRVYASWPNQHAPAMLQRVRMERLYEDGLWGTILD